MLLITFFALIGVAVVVWGTAYKLSLYKAPQLGRVPAKLCTRTSDDSKAEIERAVDVPVHPTVTSMYVALVFLTLGEVLSLVGHQRGRRAGSHDVGSFLRSLPVLFRRPPPTAFLRFV